MTGNILSRKEEQLIRKEASMANYEVWLDKENIYVRNSEGQTASKPISRFKRLMQAIEEQRNAFELSSCGIHWYENVCISLLIYSATRLTIFSRISVNILRFIFQQFLKLLF